MLVAKIELWPTGEEGQASEIGRLLITNTGDHPWSPRYGNYRYALSDDRDYNVEGQVRNFNRGDGFWALLFRTMEDATERMEANLDVPTPLP